MMTLSQVAFNAETPCQDDVPGHIQHALSLGLPEADRSNHKRLIVLANGPSAKDAPIWEGEILALNGALKLFEGRPHTPTFWAACDPQRDLILDCLDTQLSYDTTYLVASKCHPDVFKRLEGYNVRLWHVSDYPVPEGIRTIPTASSVTLVAIPLMRRLGYRAFDIWGWDACYTNGQSHATSHEPMNAEYDLDVNVGVEQKVTPRKLTQRQQLVYENLRRRAGRFGLELPFEAPPSVEYVGGRVFKTTRTWTLEAQEAMAMLQWADCEVNIHGDGMIKYLRESGTVIA